jgi:anti-anti-sigma factor
LRSVREPDRDRQAAAEELRVDRRTVDDVLVLRVVGEIDLRTGPQFQEAIEESLESRPGGRLVIDLSAASFLGSVGLAALAEAARQAEERPAVLRIVVGTNRVVRRPLEMTGLDTVLVLCEHVEDALNSPGDRGTLPPA